MPLVNLWYLCASVDNPVLVAQQPRRQPKLLRHKMLIYSFTILNSPLSNSAICPRNISAPREKVCGLWHSDKKNGRNRFSDRGPFSEMVYKPNSVTLAGRRSLIWDSRYRLPQATYPEPTRTMWADSPKRTSPAMILFHPPTLDGGMLRRMKARRASASIPYLVLHPVGFTMPAMSPCPRCALTAPFHPCHSDESEFGGMFSVALSRIQTVAGLNGWVLPTTAPCGVRTFLPAFTERPPDHFITSIISERCCNLYRK